MLDILHLEPFYFSEGFGRGSHIARFGCLLQLCNRAGVGEGTNLRRANFTYTCKRREDGGQTEQQVCPTESYLNSSGANSRRQRRQVKNS
jgi:hypothetical protein